MFVSFLRVLHTLKHCPFGKDEKACDMALACLEEQIVAEGVETELASRGSHGSGGGVPLAVGLPLTQIYP